MAISTTDLDNHRLELEELEAQCRKHRTLIKALERFLEVTPTGKARPKRRTTARGGLAGHTTGDRIIQVMADQPDRAWKISELSHAIDVPNHDSVRTTASRLRDRGELTQTADKRWHLRRLPTSDELSDRDNCTS